MKYSHRKTDPTSKVVIAMRNARRIRQLALVATALATIGGFLIAAYNATKAEGADLAARIEGHVTDCILNLKK